MTTRRLHRIFRSDGRALIVAMDHAILGGPMQGLEQPGKTIERILAGGADAVLATYGVARHFGKELAQLGLLLRCDGGSVGFGPGKGPDSIQFTVESALRLGADALVVCAYPGAPNEKVTLDNVARIVETAHRWGLPVMAEMVPGGFSSGAEFSTLEKISAAARIGAELGADIIKSPYVEDFAQVVSGTYVPIVILGGAKQGNEREMLEKIKSAVDAGGAGVAVGRNIWQAPDTTRMTAAVAAILHGQASVDDAMALL